MDKKTNFFVIPHTHWDREWYFTTSRSIIYSLWDFKEIIEHLENNDEFTSFLLDGQTSIIDDYIEFSPNDEKRLKKLIKNNRIFTGPWYTQTDQMVISGESIVRNLYYGTKRAKELGKCMMVGYMPDSFGQSAQMPHIYNGFNIENLVFRRGLGEHQINESEFYWESLDGSKVFAHNVLDYGNMYNPILNESFIKNYFYEKEKELAKKSPTRSVLLMNGSDQKPIRKDLTKTIKLAKSIYPDLNIEITNLEDALNKMKNTDYEFKTFIGEMTVGQHSRVHKSIFSSRADLKILNNKAENFIANIGEPLSTIAYKLGFDYENKIFEKCWKLLCENAAHDSIGMCNSDRTNLDVEYRYMKIFDMIENLNELMMRLIGKSIEEKDIFQFQVYNLIPYCRSSVVEVDVFTPGSEFEIVDGEDNKINYTLLESKDVTEYVKGFATVDIGLDCIYNPKWNNKDIKIFASKILINTGDIEAMGYKTLYFKEGNISNLVKKSSDTIIENDFVKVEVSDNGMCSIFNKQNHNSVNGILVFEDSGDDGDTYDYSEPYDDLYIYSNDYIIKNIISVDEVLRKTLKFEINMKIPYNLEARKNNSLNSKMKLNVEIEILEQSDIVNFKVAVENEAIEHRVRVLFKTLIESEKSIADQQFGIIERPVKLKEAKLWRERGFNEKPRTIEPLQNFVTLRNKKEGVALFTDCVREYQIIEERFDTIALTLFRSVPFMGKPNLKDRPGRPSGMNWKTPDAELIKKLDFNFSVKLYIPNNEEFNLSSIAKNLYTPIVFYQSAHFKNNANYFVLNKTEKVLPEKYSLFEILTNNTVLSACKKHEDKDGVVIRLFNPSNKKIVDEKMKINFDSKFISEVKMDEETFISKLDSDSNSLELKEINKCQSKTIFIN